MNFFYTFLCLGLILTVQCSAPEPTNRQSPEINIKQHSERIEVEGLLSVNSDLAEFLPCDFDESWYLRHGGTDLQERYNAALTHPSQPYSLVQAILIVEKAESINQKNPWESLYENVYEVVDVKTVLPLQEDNMNCKNTFYEMEAIGNEPGWTILLNQLQNKRFSYKLISDYGENNYLGVLELKETNEKNLWILEGLMPDKSPLQISILKENCIDDAGKNFPASVKVSYREKILNGCAKKISM